MTDLCYYVAVVGAGPAGMFAARELAKSGVKVVIFNRDIKPGGLAEYGIYPDKVAMKEGLRTQFKQILDTPGITYFGNITIGTNADLTLDDLRSLGFQAILVTVGSQGTKKLGLPGENLQGVYHAKDLVYHYNQLPPYSKKKFVFGRKLAVVGAGNVMMDIARFAIQKLKLDEVVAVVRRGPAEVKFDRKEMEFIGRNLDLRALDDEIARVSPNMLAVEQDPAAAKELILEGLSKAMPTNSATRFRFEFLASPTRIFGEEAVSGMEVEDNSLVVQNDEVKARGTGNKRVLNVDSVVFAIGDTVDEAFGLPISRSEFVKNPEPRFPIEGISFETFDPESRQVIPDVFVAGWARQASTGLVGYARRDGTFGARVVLQYLETLEKSAPMASALKVLMRKMGKPVVTASDIRNLNEIETAEARRRGVQTFKYSTNEEMIEKIMSIG